MASEQELLNRIDRLTRTMSRFVGEPDTHRGRVPPSSGSASAQAGMLGAAKQIRNSFSALHGSADKLLGIFGEIVEYTAIGEVFHMLMETGRELVNNYHKLTDVGQIFHGSMFEMAKMAGDSGLSLDQFSKAIERNSAVAAIMMSSQQGTSNQFVQLQKGVRDSLKDFGFYGMTLTQVTDATFDYMDVLRLNGALQNLNTQQQTLAADQMIAGATQFSVAAGKNREEIIKTTNEIMKDPSFANFAATLSDSTKTALTTAIQGMTAVGGPDLAKGLADSMKSVLGTLDLNNPVSRAFIDTGMGGIMEPMREAARAGHTSFTDMMGGARKMWVNMVSKFGGEKNLRKSLQMMETLNPEAARTVEGVVNNLAPLVGTEAKYEETLARGNAAVKAFNDPLTNAANNFESEFAKITGAFRTGFYGGILKGMTDNGVALNSFGDTLTNVMHMMEPLGIALGTLIGEVLKPSNLNTIGTTLKTLTNLLVSLVPLFTWVVNGVVSVMHTFRDILMLIPGVSKGWANMMTLVAAWAGFKLLKSFVVKYANFYISGNASGLPGGAGAEFDDHLAGTGNPTLGNTLQSKGKFAALKQLLKKGIFASWSKFFFSALIGVGASMAATSMIEAIPGLPYKDEIATVMGPLTGVLASVFGPTLLKWVTESAFSLVKNAVLMPLLEALATFGMAIFTFLGEMLTAGLALILSPEVLIPLAIGAVIVGIGFLIYKFGPALLRGIEGIFKMIGKGLSAAWGGIKEGFELYWQMEVGIAKFVLGIFSSGGHILAATFGKIWGWIEDAFSDLWNAPSDILGWIEGKLDGMGDIFSNLWHWLIDGIVDKWREYAPVALGGTPNSSSMDESVLRQSASQPVEINNSKAMTQQLAKVEELKRRDQATEQSGHGSQAVVNELQKLNSKIEQIGKAQLALQKKNNELTKDLSTGPGLAPGMTYGT